MKSKTQPSAPKPARKSSVVTQEPSVEEKRDAFVTTFMETGNASEAARVAGYHPSTAAKVMRTEDVQQALKEARAELEDISTIKRVDVMNLFMEAIDMARTMADPGNMINGADKIAKMMGYYEPEKLKVEVTTSQEVLRSKIKQLSDADLYELAYAQAKTVTGEVLPQ